MKMKKFIKVMKALSDPSRVKIIKMLQHKEMCVCEIQQALGIAQSTASKHLKILEEAGLTTYRKEGLWVNYSLADGSDSPFAASILGSLRHWLDDDPQVIQLNSRLPGIDREQICAKQSRNRNPLST
jgi:ArsR family transcriptional regulator, arsenate/arsenite/antimonite-responsive transcriptional repressor